MSDQTKRFCEFDRFRIDLTERADPGVGGASREGRRAVYEKSLEPQAMERAGKLSSGSIRVERQAGARAGLDAGGAGEGGGGGQAVAYPERTMLSCPVVSKSRSRSYPMKPQHLLSAVAVLLVLTSASSAQESAFKAGQAVYVVAVKSSKQPDLSTERKLKNEFEKRKTFNMATSLQSADFVFLMVVEYEYTQVMFNQIGSGSEVIKSVEALVVSPDAYTQSKASIDDLRDKALWRIREKDSAWRIGSLPRRIVKKFHESAAPEKR
jgi:hypothetical protein